MTILFTSRLAVPYPQRADSADVPRDIKAVADRMAAICTGYSEGTVLPSPGTHGYFFYKTDNGHLYYDIGSSWLDITPTSFSIPPDSITAAQIAPNAITQSELADGAVDNTALQGSSVTTDKILDATIQATDLADTLVPSRGAGGSAEALRALGTLAGRAAPGIHAAQHLPAGADPIDWASMFATLKIQRLLASGSRASDFTGITGQPAPADQEGTNPRYTLLSTNLSPVLDGSTPVTVEMFVPTVDFITHDQTTTDRIKFCLLEDGVQKGLFVEVVGTLSQDAPVGVWKKTYVPGAGAHTWSLRTYISFNALTATVKAGDGNGGNLMPMYLNVVG